MKFISLTGGLGNQMFIYAFCEAIREKNQKAVLHIPFKRNTKKYGHQGYEIEKIFNIKPNDGFWSIVLNNLLSLYTHALRLLPSSYKNKFYKLIGLDVVQVKENFIYYPEVFLFKKKNQLFRGTWQSEEFFNDVKDQVRSSFVFKESLLSKETKEITIDIKATNSVSIHIRRGDYLSDQYAGGFAGICNDEYYISAINYIKSKYDNLQFYIFTDDHKWVAEHFKIENARYITHNYNNNSWQDMYLMSQCKHNIIANSSFSWWGAWLNSNTDKIVIAPKVWWRGFDKDDVVPDDWIRL